MFSAKKGGFCGFHGCGCDPSYNIANICNDANSNASALAVNAGVFGNANANANSAATNVNNVRQF